MPIDVEALRRIPLFATLSQEELGHVAAMTLERHYDRGIEKSHHVSLEDT